MPKCIVCGKLKEVGITKGGKFFGSIECLKKYEKSNKSKEDNVCEFC